MSILQAAERNKAAKGTRDAEMATAHTAAPGRVSNETGMTGSTVNGTYAPATAEPKYGQPGYGQTHYGQATNY